LLRVVEDELFICLVLNKKKIFFSFRHLHQQAKTSESNAMTPRPRQQHSPPPSQHEQYSSKYASKNKKRFLK